MFRVGIHERTSEDSLVVSLKVYLVGFHLAFYRLDLCNLLNFVSDCSCNELVRRQRYDVINQPLCRVGDIWGHFQRIQVVRRCTLLHN